MASIPAMDLKYRWHALLSGKFDKDAKGNIPVLELVGAISCQRRRGDILQALQKGAVFP